MSKGTVRKRWENKDLGICVHLHCFRAGLGVSGRQAGSCWGLQRWVRGWWSRWQLHSRMWRRYRWGECCWGRCCLFQTFIFRACKKAEQTEFIKQTAEGGTSLFTWSTGAKYQHCTHPRASIFCWTCFLDIFGTLSYQSREGWPRRMHCLWKALKMPLPRHEQDTNPPVHPVYKLLCFETKLSLNSTIWLKSPAAEFHMSTNAILLECSLLRDRVSRDGMREEKIFWH